MAVTARELANTRTFNGVGASRKYWLQSASGDDEDDCRDALLAAAPATWEAGGVTLYRNDESIEVNEVGDNGPWFGEVSYGPLGSSGTGGTDDTSFEFSTAGGTQHIIASYATTQAYGTHPQTGAAAATTDNLGMIGVTKDGIEGVDVEVGALTFSITKRKAVSTLTASYLDILADLVGRLNNGTFAGTTDDGVDFSYVAGEAKFLGASGGVRGGKAVITFNFAASSNKTGLVVGTITAIAKKAWEYLWVRYSDTGTSKVAKAAYVEQVHLDGDFSTLACT